MRQVAERNVFGALDVSQGSGEFHRFAHIHNLNGAGVFLQPIRLDLPDARKREFERRPIWICGRRVLHIGRAAFEIGGHGRIQLLGMGELEVVHIARKIALAELATATRIETLFLADARHRQAAIIVRGIKQTALRQREQRAVDGAIHGARIALLEIGAAAAADEQAIAGERHAFVFPQPPILARQSEVTGT